MLKSKTQQQEATVIMREIHSRAFMVPAHALFLTSAPASFQVPATVSGPQPRKSPVFRTYLKDDAITLLSKDGIVTLRGITSLCTTARI